MAWSASRPGIRSDNSITTKSITFYELHPSWSPVGKTIAISSEKTGTRDIWSIDAFGRGYQSNLTNADGGVATYPTYGK